MILNIGKKETDQIVKRSRQTKILATLGPTSSSKEDIRALFLAGVDCFRLNFSHGNHEDHGQRLKIIRDIEKEFNHPVSVVADLQGPKLRLGQFEQGSIDIKAADRIRFDLDKTPGNKERVNIPHPEIIKALEVDQKILIDDGKVRVRIVEKGKKYVVGEIEAGHKLSDRKGVNVPGVMLDLSVLTDKDKKDLDYALKQNVDWIALSFVQRVEDILAARKIIGDRAAIMAKIEKPSAVERFALILKEADGIMLARGDLGVEIPPEQVPIEQKKIAKQVRRAGKPLVIATQMLESMIKSPTPTRAEASDVANAVYDGADAVMLSAETAAGDYPEEAVTIMNRIINTVEADENYAKIINSTHVVPHETDADAITSCAGSAAQLVGAKLIVNYTSSGSTALRTARERPYMPIVCLTPNEGVARRLAISYGIYAVVSKDISRFYQMVEKAAAVTKDHKFVNQGDSIVITAGVPFGVSGTTNILRIARV